MNTGQQNQNNIESLMRLIRRADRARKFASCFAVCSSLTDQNRYNEELRKRCAEIDITLINVALWNQGLIHNLRDVVWETLKKQFPDSQLPANLAIQVTGLEISILLDPDEEYPTILQTMNMGREAYVNDFPYPFLIWLPEYAYTKLANIAPDFWSIRYGSYTFLSEQSYDQSYDVDQLPVDRKNRTLWRDKMDQIPLIERILESDIRKTSFQTDIDLYIKLGDAYRFIGKTEKAQIKYKEASRLSLDLGDNEREGTALNGLGLIYTETGEHTKAINCFEKYLELRKYQGKDEAQAVGYNHLGLVYYRQEDYDQAIASYQKASRFAQESRTKGDVLGNLGLVYRKKKRPKTALDYHKQALQISKDTEDAQNIIKDLGNIGLAYRDLDEYEEAIKYHIQALQLSQEQEYKRDELNQHFNLGDAYRDWGKCEEAKSSYCKACELAKLTGDEKLELLALERLQDLYCPERFFDLGQEIFWMEEFIKRSESSEKLENQLHCVKKIIRVGRHHYINRYKKFDWLFMAEAMLKRLLQQPEASVASIMQHEKLIYIYGELGRKDKIKEYQKKLNDLKKFRGINIWLGPGTVEVEKALPILQLQQPYTFLIQIGSPVAEYAWICHKDFQYEELHGKPFIASKREGLKFSIEKPEKENINTLEHPINLSLEKAVVDSSETVSKKRYRKNRNSNVFSPKIRKDKNTESIRLSQESAIMYVFFKFRGDGIRFDVLEKVLSLREWQYSDILPLTIIPEEPGDHRIIVSISTKDNEFQDQFEVPLRSVPPKHVEKKRKESYVLKEKRQEKKTHFINDIIDTLKRYYPDADIDIVHKAYILVAKMHRGQTRLSGEPYLSHPIEVAAILANMKMDAVTVATGLLHDVLEDTDATYEQLQDLFGMEVAQLVDGVTKVSKIHFASGDEYYNENIRKMLLAMAKDIRVLIVKLADRLHSVRALKYAGEEQQKRVAQETLDIFAPLANRLGLEQIKSELEDQALRYLEPEIYDHLVKRIDEMRVERQQTIEIVKHDIEQRLQEHGIDATITSRQKHLYSIYRKMKRLKISFKDVMDVIGLRVITNTKADCYSTLGIIHSTWKHIPNTFTDYITLPKPNMYQSLHTDVIGPFGRPVEIQIRTWEMHHLAEEGSAAQWRYEEGKATDEEYDSKFFGLRHILEWQQDDLKDPSEFVEHLKIDLFPNDVYVFTPQGHVKSLPQGSTPVDFAYAIHTEVGHQCSGAKVNERVVPLRYRLKNGDIVEILTQKNHHPGKDWINYAVTRKAKTNIKRYFRAKQRDEITGKLQKVEKAKRIKSGSTIKVKGVDNILTRFGNCCKPLPGDDIVGFITRGRGITIHSSSCPNIKALEFDDERKIDVEWDIDPGVYYPAELYIVSSTRDAIFADIIAAITKTGADILTSNSEKSGNQLEIYSVINVHGRDHLNTVMRSVRNVRFVQEVQHVSSLR